EEMDGPLRLRQLSFGDELDVRATDLERQRAAGVVVVGALLEISLEQMPRNHDVLVRRAVSLDGRVDGLELARQRLGLDHRSQRELLAARKPRDQLVTHAWRNRPSEALCVGDDAGGGNHVDAPVRVERAVADRTDGAALGGEREDLTDASRSDRD